MTKAELAKITPEHEAYCKGCGRSTTSQDSVPYQPWNDKQDIVLFPGAVGGGNWNGVTFNKPLGLMITNVMNAGQWGHLEAGDRRRDGALRRAQRQAPSTGSGRRPTRGALRRRRRGAR